MSDFAHPFKQSWPISHSKTNTSPSAISNQLRPIGLSLLSLVYYTQNTQKSQIKVLFASSFWFEKSAFKPYFAKGLKGVPGNGADPLLKYLAPKVEEEINGKSFWVYFVGFIVFMAFQYRA